MKASASWSPSCLARYWQGAESLIPWNFTIDYSPSLLSPPLFLKSVLAWLNPPGTSSPYRRNQHHQHHPTYSPRRISLLLWPQVVGVGFVDSSSLRTVQRKCPRWFASEATLPRRSGAGLLGSGACWFMLVQAFRPFRTGTWKLKFHRVTQLADGDGRWSSHAIPTRLWISWEDCLDGLWRARSGAAQQMGFLLRGWRYTIETQGTAELKSWFLFGRETRGLKSIRHGKLLQHTGPFVIVDGSNYH